MSASPEQPDERLRRALDAFAPRARPGFREELSARLAAGAQPSLEEALDRVRPVARDEFKAQLRRRFLRSPGTEGGATPSLQRAGLRLLVGGLVGAAAALLFILLWSSDPAPAFLVDESTFVAEGLSVDGRALPASTTPEDLALRLARADSVATGEHPLRFLVADQFVVELDPATRLDLSGLRAERGPRVLANDGSTGGYRLATTPRFDRARGLEFRTPVRSLRVVGTVFGVDVLGPETVCICCAHGRVQTFCPRGLTPEEGVGASGTLFADGAELSRRTRFEDHQGPLRALREFCSSWEAAR